MDRARILAILRAIGAATCLFIGIAALKWYIWDIAIQEAGQPDRSMLFWGLPIAFIGLAALCVGAFLGLLHRRRGEQRRK